MSDIKLGGFDEPGDDADFDLTPRARKRSEAAPTSKKAAAAKPTPDPEPETVTAPEPAPRQTKPAKATAPRKVSDQAMKMTASNLQVPASLIDAIKKARTDEGLTTGQLFIVAIEASYQELQDEFQPKSTGGSLFSSNSRKTQRPAKGPLAQLNFRMSSADIDVLDRLVDEFGLESRGHLVSEAIEKYFNRKGD